MTPSVLEGAIRSGCTHLILDVLLNRSELQRLLAPERVAAAVQHLRRRACWPSRPSPPNCLVRRALLPPSSIPGAQHFLASCSYPAPLPTLLPRLQAQLGQELVVATPPAPPAGGGPAGEPAGLPAAHTQLLMSLQAAQALPPLVLQGPIATTASAARKRFRLLSIAGQGYGGKAGLAAALFCRYHGRHVELAVSSTAAAARQEQEQEVHGGDSGNDGAFDAPLSSDEDDDDLPSAVEEGEVVLAVWAPQACTAEGWGLYEFELACGELYAREGGIQRGHGAHMPCLAGVRSLLAACSSSPTPVPHVTGCRLAALRGRPRAGASR